MSKEKLVLAQNNTEKAAYVVQLCFLRETSGTHWAEENADFSSHLKFKLSSLRLQMAARRMEMFSHMRISYFL